MDQWTYHRPDAKVQCQTKSTKKET